MRTHRITRSWTVAATAALAAVALSGCTAAGAATATMNDLGHVHGLDSTGGRIFAATHQGVWALDAAQLNDGFASEKTARVGDGTQDTMGFTVARSGVMFASGHPDPANNAHQDPANLGLIESTDAARTWSTVSLAGQTDFHDITTATTGDAQVRVYGYDAARQIVRISDDSGRNWHDGATVALRKLSVNQNAPDTVLATTQTGVQISRDAGATFAPLPGTPALFLLSPIDSTAGSFVGVDTDKKIWTSVDDAATWTPKGTFQSLPGSLATVKGSSKLWILGTDSRGIVATPDDGITWTVLVGGTP
ncbi:F510_1955 family glycosylhydrolase [Leifsonia sp. NPDC014704]|uniref:F510_1955 family glycosylhydrolase n=2 Tax=unclassified Leifsonia TaxID=2663824 RepID=UPI000A18DA09